MTVYRASAAIWHVNVFSFFFFLFFFNYKNKPYVISRQKHLLYRVRIIIICITNIFATISLICISYALYFLSILHIIVVLPQSQSPPKTKTIRIHVFWTRSFLLWKEKTKISTVLNYTCKLLFVVGRYSWRGMFFGVGCSADVRRMQFHSANCRVCSVRMRSVYDQSARFMIHPVSGIWHHR